MSGTTPSRPGSHQANHVRPSFDGPEDGLVIRPTYDELLEENRMLRIQTLQLRIAHCYSLCLIERFLHGQANGPNGPPSHRQVTLQQRIAELEAMLLELRSRPVGDTTG